MGLNLPTALKLQAMANDMAELNTLLTGALCALGRIDSQEALLQPILPKLKGAQLLQMRAHKASEEMVEWLAQAVNHQI